MLKCKICGKEFEANIERHYIARDDGKIGLAAIVSNNEERCYDVFDCPSCGCQVIAQERKRKLTDDNFYEEDLEECMEEDTECKEEHDGCKDCKYVSYQSSEYPCCICKHCYNFGSEEFEFSSCRWEKE